MSCSPRPKFLNITLREVNQYADFFTKFGAFPDVAFLTHISPAEGVCDLLKNDAMETLFPM
jgi:hypothetical protein